MFLFKYIVFSFFAVFSMLVDTKQGHWHLQFSRAELEGETLPTAFMCMLVYTYPSHVVAYKTVIALLMTQIKYLGVSSMLWIILCMKLIFSASVLSVFCRKRLLIFLLCAKLGVHNNLRQDCHISFYHCYLSLFLSFPLFTYPSAASLWNTF